MENAEMARRAALPPAVAIAAVLTIAYDGYCWQAPSS
jgi:hypothetical protein